MSNTIDEKVVEMRFDNKDFETNIKDTMKTLDEFKKQLKFEGASEGFDNISKNAGKINFNGLSDAIDTVKVKFSALEVIGITALTNITNSAINAGKRIVESLTIAPIKSGYEEYELTLNTVKTVMNATGKSAKEVESELKRLDDYADKTIYSTADMFTNISKFTNVGVPLEDASTAMIGIANATALAGRGAREASIAMYNLGQAIGVGYLNRIDYKSLQNAGIDTNEWKEAMIEAALAAGTLTKAQDGMYKSGNKLYTMQNLFIDGLQTQWATRDVMMKVLTDYGSTEEEIGKKAWKAAQEVRTFSGMMEALKASVGTGWKETWQLLFGDLDEATKFWTRINDFVSGIIKGFTDKRNDFLKGVLDPISPLLEKIGESSKAVKETVDAVKDYANVVDEIISGKWGNGQSRWDKLTEAGYDWAHAQNLVNERLGSSVRYSTNFSESQEHIITSEGKVIDTTGKYIQALSEMDDATLLSTLGDEEKAKAVRDIQRHAEKLGVSVEELVDKSNELNGRTLIIESIANIGNSLVKIFESVGKAWNSIFSPLSADTIYDIVAGLYKFSNIIKNYVNNNADRLTRTFKGLFSILKVVSNLVKGALNIGFTALKIVMSLFGKSSEGVLEVTANLGDVLTSINNILNNYIISTINKVVGWMNSASKTAKEWILNNTNLIDNFTKLKDKFYSIIDTIKEYTTDSEKLKEGLNLLKDKVEEVKNKFVEWIQNNETLNTIFQTFSDILNNVVTGIQNFIESNETLQNIFSNIQTKIDDARQSLENWYNSLNSDDSKTIGENIVDGIANGITYAAKKAWEAILKVAQKIKEVFCSFFRIESPSKESQTWGEYIIEGLKNGLKDNFPKIYAVLKTIYDSIKNVSFEMVSSIIWPLSTIFPQLKFLDLPRQFLNLFKACGMNSVAGLQEGLKQDHGIVSTIKDLAQKIINIFKGEIDSHSPSKVFMAIGGMIIAGLIIGLKDGFPQVGDTIKSLGKQIVDFFKNLDYGKILAVGMIGGVFFIVLQLIGVMKSFSTVATQFIGIANRLTAPLKGIGDALTGLGKMYTSKGEAEKTRAKGEAIRNMALSVGIIAASIYIISKINKEDLIRSSIVIGAIVLVVAALYGLIIFLNNKFPGGMSSNFDKSINSLIKVSASVLLLALALKLISMIDFGDNVLKTFGTLITLVGLIAVLMVASTAAGKNASQAGSMILKISIAMLIMVKVIKQINELSDSDVSRALIVITLISGIFVALIFISTVANEFSKGSGAMIIKMAASILIMVLAIKLISKISDEDLAKGLKVINEILRIFLLLIFASGFAQQFTKDAGRVFLEFSAAIIILVLAIKMIAKMDIKDIAKGIAVIAAIGILFAGLLYITKFSGKDMIKAGAFLIETSAALLIVVGVLFLLTKIDDKDLWRSLGIIAILEALFAGLIAVTHFAKDVKDTIIAMTVCIGLLIGAVALLTLLDQEKLKSSTKCVAILLVAMGLFVAMTKFAPGIKKAITTVVLLGLVIAEIGGILKYLDGINAVGAIANATAISELLLILSICLVILGKAKNIDKKVIFTMSVLALVIIEIGGILKYLDGINPNNAIANATAISELLLALTICLTILSKAKNIDTKTIVMVALLGLVVGEIGFIISKMNNIDPKKAILNSIAISELLLAMTVCIMILSNIKNISFQVIGALALLGLVVGEIALIFGIMNKFNVEPSIKTATALSIMLIAMTAALGALTLIGMAGPAALIGAGELLAIITVLGVVLGGLGLLVSKFPQIEEFVNKGANLFIRLGEILGEFIGAIVGGIANAMLDLLPKTGEKLSEFMENLGPFLNDINSVDGNVAKNAGYLALAILAISASEIVAGIASFIPNASGFGNMGSDLSTFMTNAKPFFDGVSQISPETLQGVLVLSKAILALTAGELLQGITKFIGGGEVDLSKFGSQLAGLADGINTFAEKVKDIDSKAVEKVKAACEAITAIADANSKIPNSGGWLANIVGDNKIDEFGEAMPKLGAGLNGFVNALNGFNDSKIPIVTAACEAITKIADTNKNITNTGGWLANIIGDNDIGQFGEKIETLGKGLNSFIVNLKDFTTDSSPIVESACNAIKKLADLGNSIGDSGWYSKLIGESDLEKFSKSIPELGKGINGFVSQLSDFSSGKVTIVNSACEAITSISNLGNIDLATLSSNLNDFGLKLTNFGADIYTFVSLLEEVGLDTIEACVGKVNSLITMANTIASVSIESLSAFSTSLVQVATDGVNNFCLAFSGEEPVEQVKQAIIILIDALITTIDSKKQDIYNKFIELMNKALEAMRSKKTEFVNVTIELCNAVLDTFSNYYDAMYQVGCDFAMGFVEGMRSKIEEAARAAAEMARAALQAAKAAIDSNSPSKETMALGGFFGEGFMLGIKSYSRKVYNEAYDVGDTAKDGLSKAISKISSIIDNGIDTSPTIRPVLDLSNLESGVSRIDSMFNNGTVALNGNVDSISNNFKLRSQNGLNSSIEEAINNLSNKLQGLLGNTLNIYTQELDSNKLDQIVVYVDKHLGIKYLVK